MRLVNHQHRNPTGHIGEDFFDEVVISQAFRGDEQYVNGVIAYLRFHRVPFLSVVRIDGHRTDAHTLRRRNLVAHQRQ